VSTGARAAATRSNVVRLQRRLGQVEKGATLLRKKREALVAALFARAKGAVDTRRAIDEQARAAYLALLEALAAVGAGELGPLAWPTREVKVDLEPREVFGIRGVELASPPRLVRTVAARGAVAGAGDAASSAAAEAFERLVEQLLAAAPEELFMRRLGHALAHATRLVNTLEQRVAASLAHDIAAMRRTLEEREREEQLRLKRIVASRGRR
jgi:V/A-type H+-transporting ATPase subunit D